jgi:hypothetical protein
MVHLHRHIRFTLEVTLEARTDSVAQGADLKAMLAHVAAERLSRMTAEDLRTQVRVMADRPAHIAPFVRRRHHHLVSHRNRAPARSTQGETLGSIRRTPTTPRRRSA